MPISKARRLAPTQARSRSAVRRRSPRLATAYPYTPGDDVLPVAREHLGIDSFRPGQRELVEAVLQGRDALGVMPTGGGKSLVYQLASLYLDKPVIVVSPLLALMRDQADKLDGFDVPGARLDSTLSAAEERAALERTERGHLDLLFVTPEALRRPEVRDAIAAQGASLFVVDEAHCVSSWGHDFRPAYLALRDTFEQLGRPPVLALTATAPKRVRDDIREVLGLRDPVEVRASCIRPNLALHVRRTASEEAKRQTLLGVLEEHRGEAGIVYCSTIKRAEELRSWLHSEHGITVGCYHGSRTAKERAQVQAEFMSGAVPVIVATKAFGMGIDKPDVRFVVHDAFPDSLESYLQEAGRAGRDGRPASAFLLYRLEDKRVQHYFLRGKYATRREIERVFAAVQSGLQDPKDIAKQARVTRRKAEALLRELPRGLEEVVAQQARLAETDKARIREIMGYGEHVTCRWAQVQQHFDEAPAPRCDRCDVCSTAA